MSELVPKVKSWLESQGYPLEMAVAREFATRGFRTVLSTYYSDPVTEKPREIDVTAVRGFEDGRSVIRVVVTVECKSSKRQPWLLLASPNDLQLPGPDCLFLTGGDMRGRLRKSFCDSGREAPRLFAPGCPVGYSVVVARLGSKKGESERTDRAYEACMQAVSAARSFAPAGLHYVMGGGMINTLAIPLVVVEGSLVVVSLAREHDKSELNVSECGRGAVLWSHPEAGARGTLLYVVTRAALQPFLDELEAAVDAILERGPSST